MKNKMSDNNINLKEATISVSVFLFIFGLIIYLGIFIGIQHRSLLFPFLSKEKINQTLKDSVTYNLASNCDYSIHKEEIENYCSALSKRMDNLNQSSFLFLRTGDLVFYLYNQNMDNINKQKDLEKNEQISCLASGKCQ